MCNRVYVEESKLLLDKHLLFFIGFISVVDLLEISVRTVCLFSCPVDAGDVYCTDTLFFFLVLTLYLS